MAVLAQVRHAFFSQLVCLCSVRCMAIEAVLFDRRVWLDKRSTFIGMAGVTELVDGLRFDHRLGHGTVGVVAIGALDLAFDNRVMRELVGFGTHVLVAFEAFFRLLGVRLGRFVHGVAGCAGDIFLLVLGVIPEHQFLVLGVAGLARGILLLQ